MEEASEREAREGGGGREEGMKRERERERGGRGGREGTREGGEWNEQHCMCSYVCTGFAKDCKPNSLSFHVSVFLGL